VGKNATLRHNRLVYFIKPLYDLIKTEASARICFFGDHQDYLNLPVIAGTINRKIKIKAVPNNKSNYLIQLFDLNKVIDINLNQKLNKIDAEDYYRSSIAVLQKEGAVFQKGYNIEISGKIPINAGVSSSSALVIAWLRFLVKAQENPKLVSKEQIGKWAYNSEVLFFDQPGGFMDQYTIAQGGLLYIDIRTKKNVKLNSNLGKLILVESGIPKQTLGVLKKARKYAQKAIESVKLIDDSFDIYSAGVKDYEKYAPFVPAKYLDHWFAIIHNHVLTQKAKKILLDKKVDIVTLGKLMNKHQNILDQRIQNTPEIMRKQMNSARNAGALGTKIIGSGGGGCMVAMVTDDSKQKVIDAFLHEGALAAYEVKLNSC